MRKLFDIKVHKTNLDWQKDEKGFSERDSGSLPKLQYLEIGAAPNRGAGRGRESPGNLERRGFDSFENNL
jgi:hypothetical protein